MRKTNQKERSDENFDHIKYIKFNDHSSLYLLSSYSPSSLLVIIIKYIYTSVPKHSKQEEIERGTIINKTTTLPESET